MAGPVYADKITGNSNTCIASPGGNYFDFSISGDLTDCGTHYVANETHISYSNAIQCAHGMKNGLIQRRKRFIINFSCTFEREQLVSSGKILTSTAHVELDLGTKISSFVVALSLMSKI